MENAHAASVDEVVKFFNTDENVGLSEKQVEIAKEKYGLNGKFVGFRFNHVLRNICVLLLMRCQIISKLTAKAKDTTNNWLILAFSVPNYFYYFLHRYGYGLELGYG